MTVAAPEYTRPTEYRTGSGTLYDVLELILDRGLVIDAFVRVSLVGIELLRIDVRVVVASVDTYLRFAEACNRLDLDNKGGDKLSDLVGDTTEKVGQGKTKGAITGAVESVAETLGLGQDKDKDQGDEDEGGARDEEKEPAPRRRSSSRSRRTEGS